MDVFRLTAESVWLSCILGCTEHQLVKQGDLILLRSVLVWPHLGHCVQLWAPQFKKHVKGTQMCPEEGRQADESAGSPVSSG